LSLPLERSCYFAFIRDAPSHSSYTDKESQVEEYLSTPCLPENADPLTFWKSHQHKRPKLAKLVCRYLQILASSGPVERLFSIAGEVEVFRPDKASLNDKLLEKIMICSNLNHAKLFYHF